MFESIGNFFYITLYQPLFNSLVFLYNIIPGNDFGLAIIFLTLAIRFVLYPLSRKALKSQTSLQKLQPQIQEIQKKYKDDKERQAKEVLALYQKEKINPFSGILVTFIQLPILIALYRVFAEGLNPKELSVLYNFITNPGQLNAMFLGLIDLSKANLIIAILAGLVQYWQTKMIIPKKIGGGKDGKADLAHAMQKNMAYFFPIFTVVILMGLPSALGVYWITSGAFSIAQQYLIFKKKKEEAKQVV